MRFSEFSRQKSGIELAHSEQEIQFLKQQLSDWYQSVTHQNNSTWVIYGTYPRNSKIAYSELVEDLRDLFAEAEMWVFDKQEYFTESILSRMVFIEPNGLDPNWRFYVFYSMTDQAMAQAATSHAKKYWMKKFRGEATCHNQEVGKEYDTDRYPMLHCSENSIDSYVPELSLASVTTTVGQEVP